MSTQTIKGVHSPKTEVELFGGPSYLRANTVTSGAHVDLNGASGSIAWDVSRWLGGVGDFGFY